MNKKTDFSHTVMLVEVATAHWSLPKTNEHYIDDDQYVECHRELVRLKIEANRPPLMNTPQGGQFLLNLTAQEALEYDNVIDY